MHAPGERQVRLAALQAGHRLMDRHQRGRAGGIQRQGRPFQPEREGDPADGGVEGGAGDRIEAGGGLVRLRGFQNQPAILVVADPRIDAGAAAFQAVRVHAGVFQRAPAGLQHHPLLRIQELRLHRRDAEEGGVEELKLVEVGAEAAGRGLRGVGEERADAADAGAGFPFDHPALARLQHAPEGGKPVRAGKAAGHADDRDRLVRPGDIRRTFPGQAGRVAVPAAGPVSLRHRGSPSVRRTVRNYVTLTCVSSVLIPCSLSSHGIILRVRPVPAQPRGRLRCRCRDIAGGGRRTRGGAAAEARPRVRWVRRRDRRRAAQAGPGCCPPGT